MSTIIGLVSTFRLPLQSKLDWMLKQGEGTMKSKKEVKAGWIGR